jgi:hypothetical protein
MFAKFGRWSRHAGPEPGMTGCRASPELLVRYTDRELRRSPRPSLRSQRWMPRSSRAPRPTESCTSAFEARQTSLPHSSATFGEWSFGVTPLKIDIQAQGL